MRISPKIIREQIHRLADCFYSHTKSTNTQSLLHYASCDRWRSRSVMKRRSGSESMTDCRSFNASAAVSPAWDALAPVSSASSLPASTLLPPVDASPNPPPKKSSRSVLVLLPLSPPLPLMLPVLLLGSMSLLVVVGTAPDEKKSPRPPAAAKSVGSFVLFTEGMLCFCIPPVHPPPKIYTLTRKAKKKKKKPESTKRHEHNEGHSQFAFPGYTCARLGDGFGLCLCCTARFCDWLDTRGGTVSE